MVDVLTLAGGGLITLKRLVASMHKHFNPATYRHIVLCQGDVQAQDYLMKFNCPSNMYILFSPVNLKLSIGYNHLLEFSSKLKDKSDFIFFLDDDFEVSADIIAKMTDYIHTPSIDVAAMEHSYSSSRAIPKNRQVELCGGGTLFFPRSVFNKVGYIDEGFWSEWDTDYTKRMTLCHGLKISIVPKSANWARHYLHVGQRRYGMKLFRIRQRESEKLLLAKWTKQFAGQQIQKAIIEKIGARDPLHRQGNSLTDIIVRCNNGIFKT